MNNKVIACGKLNLTLDVVGKREDGYHDILSVFQSVGLCDIITITTDCRNWSIKSDSTVMPNDDSNLALKAARAFAEKTGISRSGMEIDIVKQIPIFAGFGGGSADAGTVLMELNSRYGDPLCMDELDELALEIGSDVPFFLRGGTCLVSGRGENVKPIAAFPDCHLIVCKPPADFSAGQMYSLLDSRVIEKRPDTNAFVAACEKGDLKDACSHIYNVFEPLATELCPDVSVIKDIMLSNGALAASLTGKGPSVFGLFDDFGKMAVTISRLLKKYKNTYYTDLRV